MATTGFLEQRDAVAGFFLHSSLSTANRPRDTSRPVNTYHVDAGNAGRFLARPGDVPVHRLKAWLNAPISE